MSENEEFYYASDAEQAMIIDHHLEWGDQEYGLWLRYGMEGYTPPPREPEEDEAT